MTAELMQLADRVIAQTYNRFPVVFERGEGCTLWDTQGRSYIDFVAGIAVCSLGHCHPAVSAAVADQARQLCHVSNLYYTIPQTRLAEMLVSRSFADRVFFCNSGAEANEAAIKLARKYFYEKGEPGRTRIISMEQSFHGRTMAALSATGQDKIRKGFDPLLGGFEFIPYNNIGALENAMDASVCAVMMEPVQGEGGVICPDPGFVQKVRRLCDDNGVLLIFDEVQTGMGRTGTLFGYEHSGVAPDIMSLAKALANGLPIGAMLAVEEVASAFGPGAHASTFGGGPLVTAAALATLGTLTNDDVVGHCAAMGTYFKSKLQGLKEKHGCVEAVRGQGLLVGLKLKQEAGSLVTRCMEEGFLINCIQDSVLRFVPPLIIGKSQIDALVDCLDNLLSE